MPSCAPRPVPTSSAVGVASPSAHGQAMMSTATAAENANVAASPRSSQNASVPSASAITTGTNTADTRSARRCTSALPLCASVTSRPIWASWVSAPTRVARTTRRPARVDRGADDGVAGADLDGYGLAGEQARVDRAAALDNRAVGGDLLAGADDEDVADSELADRDPRLGLCAVRAAQDGDVLGAELQQGGHGRARASLRAGLGVAAGEQEHRHQAGDLEVDLAAGRSPRRGEREGHRHAAHPGVAEEQRVQRPAEGGQHAHADEGVHGGRAVPGVGRGGAVERPGAPDGDGCGEGQREPLPVGELQRRDHAQEEDRDAERGRGHEPVAERPQRVGGVRSGRVVGIRRGGQGRRVAGGGHRGEQLVGRHVARVLDMGLLGGVVDARGHAVELVELALDPAGAGGAGHAGDLQVHGLRGRRRGHATTS